MRIITFSLQYPALLFPGRTQYSTEPAPENLHIERRINSVNPLNWLKVGKAIRKDAPDLLLVPFWLPYMAPCLGTIARIASRSRKTFVEAILHNLIPHEKRPGDLMFTRYFCKPVNRFIALSGSVLEDIEKIERKKERAFQPHPIYDNFGEAVSRDEACIHLGLNPKDKILLSFGLIRDYKGLDWLLEAFAMLENRDGVKLVVAGEFYSDGTKYHNLAKSLGIDEEVIWKTDFVPDSEVKYYFCAADLVIQPYKSATQSGITQIAYHFERPMLVTHVGGLPEIVPDGKVGYVVEPSPKAIASAMKSFLQNPPDFSEGLREEKKKYSWSEMAGTILKGL